MKLAVTDANIFIDLIKLQMLGFLFGITMEIHTSREVVDQLNRDQAERLNDFIHAGELQVYHLTQDEMESIESMESPRSLEITDKTIVFISLKLQAMVLSGDAPLRRFCESKSLEVKGIIWLFDVFLELRLISHGEAALKMKELMSFNPRLPTAECLRRLERWEDKRT